MRWPNGRDSSRDSTSFATEERRGRSVGFAEVADLTGLIRARFPNFLIGKASGKQPNLSWTYTETRCIVGYYMFLPNCIKASSMLLGCKTKIYTTLSGRCSEAKVTITIGCSPRRWQIMQTGTVAPSTVADQPVVSTHIIYTLHSVVAPPHKRYRY